MTGADTGSATGTVTGDTSTSGDASMTVSTVTTGSGDSTVTYHVADATLPDATVLRSAFAQDAFGTNITEDTSDIAEDNGAVFAVNGDYRGFRDTGIEIRNGVVYRDEGAREGLAFYRDGTVEVYDETTTTADDLVADGAGGPAARGQLRAARRPDRPGDAAAAGQGGHRGAAGGAGYAVQRSLVFRRRAAAPQVPVAPPPRELVLR
ncbi:hypothetical protein SAMN05660657_01626 [Geodermatophilus amargosae]|uniref:Uncharacterized protein n=1 Tax=Geodermatophilus amargosae TaxID=1296565 RepID=A0A1I6Z2P7_9ACTN|nr:hypothetical protein [Geodermatophilus amargosae]SFT56983.1 hypothetical protein SAMN05660657_01626 [Geodermatophilus amargosae]